MTWLLLDSRTNKLVLYIPCCSRQVKISRAIISTFGEYLTDGITPDLFISSLYDNPDLQNWLEIMNTNIRIHSGKLRYISGILNCCLCNVPKFKNEQVKCANALATLYDNLVLTPSHEYCIQVLNAMKGNRLITPEDKMFNKSISVSKYHELISIVDTDIKRSLTEDFPTGTDINDAVRIISDRLRNAFAKLTALYITLKIIHSNRMKRVILHVNVCCDSNIYEMLKFMGFNDVNTLSETNL